MDYNILLYVCLISFILLKTGTPGRLQQNINCGHEWVYYNPRRPADFDEEVLQHEDNPNALSGFYFDYALNFVEQLEPSNFGDATVAHNLRLNATDEKRQITDQPPVLFQEGRSFCISGEHFKNSETLLRYPEFAPFRALAENNFDIGSHISPDDYAQMNIHPWSTFDRRLPLYDFMQATPAYSIMYAWEPSDAVFFHTRLTDPDRSHQSKVKLPSGQPISEPDRLLPRTAGFYNRPSASIAIQPGQPCRNPYFIDVTEIDANGIRLHNWLHITVYADRRTQQLNMNSNLRNCPKGKMKWIMLEVRDSLGLPIGDFNTDVPCGTSCKCKSKMAIVDGKDVPCVKISGTKRNSMPCMYTPLRSITQPGLFLYAEPSSDGYFTELHVNWHFAQHTSYFASELHVAALIVEDIANSSYYTSRQTKYEKPADCNGISRCFLLSPPYTDKDCNNKIKPDGCCCSGGGLEWQWQELIPVLGTKSVVGSQFDCNPPQSLISDARYFNSKNNTGYYSFSLQHISATSRPYGWTPQYKTLSPTFQTLGGWDAFNPEFVQLDRMNCHKKINSLYFQESTYKKSRLPKRSNLFRWNSSYEVYPWNGPRFGRDYIYNKTLAVDKAKNDTANFFSVYSLEKLYYETEDESYRKNLSIKNDTRLAKVSRFYFGTANTRDAYDGYSLPKEIQDQFDRLKTIEQISEEERCACPVFGTTEDPSKVTKSVQVLQGRSTHATQMLLAWVVLVPIAIFVIRYYKETYMRVFLLHEFWWYSVHFLCLITALLFMIGGILAIEYKRIEKSEWSDELLAHVMFGSVACSLFVVHLLLGALRLSSVTLRCIQITLHFAFGVLEYFLAVTAIIIATWIPQGRMACAAYYTYIVFIVLQVLLYAGMEVHTRYVDKIMQLYPPRQYCPVPTVRVFHRTTPLSKFRIIVLGCYCIVCWLFYLILRIEVQQDGASCFNDLGNEYDEDIYENF